MKNKTTALPQLRFPEFRGAREWKKKTIGEENFATFYKGRSITRSDITPDGKTACIRYGELYTHYGEVIKIVLSKTNIPVPNLFFSRKNDVIIPSSGETKIDIATASCVTVDGVALGGDLNVIRSNHNGIFISYYLNGALKKEISKISQGDTVVHLYITQLKKIEIFIPFAEEQKKIADCLSSIDELIASQKEKLEALQEHKKGLMQQLFPAEGKTVPRLRFPEFRGAEVWKVEQLGDLGYFLPSLTGKNKDDFIFGNSKYIPYMNVFSNTVILRDFLGDVKVSEHEQQTKVKKGDVLFTVSSETPGDVGMSSVLTTDIKNCYVNSFCRIFRFNTLDQVNLIFIAFLMRSVRIRRYFSNVSQGVTRFNLSKSHFFNVPVSIPRIQEQKKIADCLLSIDKLITAQKEKLDALQEHKNGLMQQLFPTTNEVPL